MRIDIIMLEREIEHAKKGDTKCARKIFGYLQNYLEADTPLPNILASYLAEASAKIIAGDSADKAFYLRGKRGNQYSAENTLKEIIIAVGVHGLHSYVEYYVKTGKKQLAILTSYSPEAIDDLHTNCQGTIEYVCSWIENNKIYPLITDRVPKNTPPEERYMKADRIMQIYTAWIDGIREDDRAIQELEPNRTFWLP